MREMGIWREMGARCARRSVLKAVAMVYVGRQWWRGEWRVVYQHSISMRAGRPVAETQSVVELRSDVRLGPAGASVWSA